MNQPTKPNCEKEEGKKSKDWKGKGNRALIINIIFFLILFGSIFLIPVTGLTVTIIIVLVAFAASMLYIYFV